MRIPVAELVAQREHTTDLPEYRTDWAGALPEVGSVAVRDPDIPGPELEVRARLYLPLRPAHPTAALVWVHGGGFLFGDLDGPEAHWVSLMLAARRHRSLVDRLPQDDPRSDLPGSLR